MDEGSDYAPFDHAILARRGRRCQSEGMRTTLYDFAGGGPAFLALAQAHHARCLADPELNHPFSHEDLNPHHVERLGAYWAEVMGGPPVYSREYSDHSAMLNLHAGRGIPSLGGSSFMTS